jgi:hypothetical protein
MAVDLNWYPPNTTWITNLADIINGTGTFGFGFSDQAGHGVYGGYNWCDMPHVRTEEYVRAGEDFELVYVEVVGFIFSFCLVSHLSQKLICAMAVSQFE